MFMVWAIVLALIIPLSLVLGWSMLVIDMGVVFIYWLALNGLQNSSVSCFIDDVCCC